MQGGSTAPTAAAVTASATSRAPSAARPPGPYVGRAVVVGSGSAGRRHLASLRHAAPDLATTLVRRDGAVGVPASLDLEGVDVVSGVDQLADGPVRIGVVAGPAPTHLDAAVALIGRDASAVLVEKPLSTDDADLSPWQRPELRQRVVVGYHLRFGDVLPELRRLITDGAIGDVSHVELMVGQHLSQWRPGTDPAASVSARSELGGGVLLELSHELDALRVLVDDEVAAVTAARLRTDGAPTDGRVETVAELELVMTAGVVASAHLDMTSDPAVRRWQITGTTGTLRADLLDSTIWLDPADTHGNGSLPGDQVFCAPPGERDRAEARLIDHVLAVAAGQATPGCTVSDGLRALQIVAAARRSAATGRPVQLPATTEGHT